MQDSNLRLSLRTIARPLSKKRYSHCDVRASVASLPFEQRNTTRRMSFTYRLLDRASGRRLLTETPNLCAVALACKARTDLRYPLPLTIDDVGIAGCTTTCSFEQASIPVRRTVLKPVYFRVSLGRYPQRLHTEDSGGRTCLDRPDPKGSGGMPWDASLSRRCRRLSSARPQKQLAGTAGFEPATSPLTAERSTSELHAKSGGGGRSRTSKARRAAGLQPA